MRHMFSIVILAVCLVVYECAAGEVSPSNEADEPAGGDGRSSGSVGIGGAGSDEKSTTSPEATSGEQGNSVQNGLHGKVLQSQTEDEPKLESREVILTPCKTVDKPACEKVSSSPEATVERVNENEGTVVTGSTTGAVSALANPPSATSGRNVVKESGEMEGMKSGKPGNGESLEDNAVARGALDVSQEKAEVKDIKERHPGGSIPEVNVPVQQVHKPKSEVEDTSPNMHKKELNNADALSSSEGDRNHNPTQTHDSSSTRLPTAVEPSVNIEGRNANTHHTSTENAKPPKSTSFEDSPSSAGIPTRTNYTHSNTATLSGTYTNSRIAADAKQTTGGPPAAVNKVDSTTEADILNDQRSTSSHKVTSTVQTTPLPPVSQPLPLPHSVDKTDFSLCISSLFALAALATLAVVAAAPAH